MFCERCLNPFRLQSALDKHLLICSTFKPAREVFPTGDKKFLKFSKYEYQLPAPFIVFGDIETLLVPESTATHDVSKSGSTTLNHHQPCSTGYVIISMDPKYNFQPKLFGSEHCIRYFLDSLQQDYLKLKKIVEHLLKMTMTSEECRMYENARECWICEKEITNNQIKVTAIYLGNFVVQFTMSAT